jgi:hypothetical protein
MDIAREIKENVTLTEGAEGDVALSIQLHKGRPCILVSDSSLRYHTSSLFHCILRQIKLTRSGLVYALQAIG